MHQRPIVFRRATTAFQPYGEGEGNASIARLVGPQDSQTMGAYLARFDERPVTWKRQDGTLTSTSTSSA